MPIFDLNPSNFVFGPITVISYCNFNRAPRRTLKNALKLLRFSIDLNFIRGTARLVAYFGQTADCTWEGYHVDPVYVARLGSH